MQAAVPSFDYRLPYASRRSPVFARNVVVTSQPLAAQAGLQMLLAGGNAADASVACAIALTVVEPTSNGVGSDAFAVLWDGKGVHGLNASGRSPAAWQRSRFSGLEKMPGKGWDSVTVPGAVSAWVELSKRFGKLPFQRLFEPAIRYAREGFAVTPEIAANWARGAEVCGGQPGFADAFLPGGRPPKPGEVFVNAPLADTLRSIASTEGQAFYQGHLAAKMIRHAASCGGTMTLDDLAEHRADWCGTLSQRIGEVTLHEIPPNGQGIATLIAAGILERLGVHRHGVDSPEALHLQLEAMKLGLADAAAFVADPSAMAVDARMLLRDEYLAERAALIDPHRAGEFGAGAPRAGGTVYLAAGDSSGMMVSFIQSNYEGFGSGVVVPGTGISLQNRGVGFVLKPGHPNDVGPRKRPFHTIIPGFAMRGDRPAIAFGLQGGPVQAQGQLQLLVRTQLFGQNPQAAIDAPRWRFVKGREVSVEAALSESVVRALQERGHIVQRGAPDTTFLFGGAQMLCRTDSGYVAGSDPRKDGCAVGF